MLHRCQEDQNRAQGRGSPSLTHHRGAVMLVVVPGRAGSSAAGPSQHLAASQAGFFSLDLMGLKKNHSKKGRTCKIKQEKHRCRAYSLIAFSPPLQGSVAAALPQPRGISALPEGWGLITAAVGLCPLLNPPVPVPALGVLASCTCKNQGCLMKQKAISPLSHPGSIARGRPCGSELPFSFLLTGAGGIPPSPRLLEAA